MGVPVTAQRLKILESVIDVVENKERTSRERDVDMRDEREATADPDSDTESRASKRSRTELSDRLSEPEDAEEGYSSPDCDPPPASDIEALFTDNEDCVSLGDDTEWEDFDAALAELKCTEWRVTPFVHTERLLTKHQNSRRCLIEGSRRNGVGGSERGNDIFVLPAFTSARMNKNVCSKKAVWLLDSGASLHFTNKLSDFADYSPLTEEIIVTTANGKTTAKGKGTVILRCEGQRNGAGATVRIAPVYYMPELTSRLLSMGEFLRDGLSVKGSLNSITLVKPNGKAFLTFHPRSEHDTIYCVKSADSAEALNAHALVTRVEYTTMHRRFAHPSRTVLQHAKSHTLEFPVVNFPRDDPICGGCAQGKMPMRPFPASSHRATRCFELIHSDLKSFPVESYRKNKYAIIYVDDYSSHAWLVCMRNKNASLSNTRQFLAYAENQYESTVQKWMSDAGGEYKSEAFDSMLKERGIKILQSAPHTHQQNGRAERFIRTVMDKAEAMRIEAGIPDSWWEFAVLHAVHVYNRTPMKRLDWKTPYELLYGEQPRVDHLRVFGCGAYVHIPPETRKNKLAPKSELMIYLGVAPGGHGNIFMRLPNNVVFTSAPAVSSMVVLQ